MKLAIIGVAIGCVLGGSGIAFSQDLPFEQERHQKAFSKAQTDGPPPSYSLEEVTVLLFRRVEEPAAQDSIRDSGVTLSGAGKTAYVRRTKENLAKKQVFGDKSEQLPDEELFAVLEEAYRLGFFSMSADYTKRVYVQRDTAGAITTHYGEPTWRYPTVSLIIRIGDYEKNVKAIDRVRDEKHRGAPGPLLELAKFIESIPSVRGLFQEIESQ